MIPENKTICRKELRRNNLLYDVLMLIFNKFKDRFFFKKELWLNLPSDVLRLIFNKLKTKYVFARVCRTWRMIANDEIFWLLRSCGPKSILLLLPYMQGTVDIVKFSYEKRKKSTLIEKTNVSFTTSKIQIIGSCRGGWTFLFQNNTQDLKLWSPLFDIKIRLPYFSSRVIKAATFFGDDFGIGVAVISEDEKLSFVKYGDFKWSYLCGCEVKGGYEDLISSKDSILALSKNGESIHAWNFEGKNILNVKLDFPLDMAETKESQKYIHKLYIVESEGRIFIVVRWLSEFMHSEFDQMPHYYLPHYYRTVNFYVYILDKEKREWSRVKSLGDEALFVGKNQTMSLHTKDFEQCQKNSIYFGGHYCERISGENNGWNSEYYGYTSKFCLDDSNSQMYGDDGDEFYNSLASCWIVSGV